jgi:hypothetical protein
MFFEDKEKRNMIYLMVFVIFFIILFAPLFTVKKHYSGDSKLSSSGAREASITRCDVNEDFDITVKNISFSKKKPSKDCSINSGNICFSEAFIPKPISKEECNSLKFDLGIKECGYDEDMWAGAVKKCGGVNNMASPKDLAFLAESLYKFSCNAHPKISETQFYKGMAELDTDKAKYFRLKNSNPIELWSNLEADGLVVSGKGELAFGRNYYKNTSSWYPYERYGKNNKRMAVCVYRD